MNRFLMHAIAGPGFVLMLSAANASDVAEVLRLWEGLRGDVGRDRVVGYANAVRDGAKQGGREVLSGLLRIVKNTSQPVISRGVALEVACELADQQGALLMLGAVRAIWADGERAVQAGEGFSDPNAAPFASRELLAGFIREGVPRLLQTSEDLSPILGFLKWAYLTPSVPAKHVCARLIGECGAPRELKQSTIVAIIRSGPAGGIPDAWVEIMDAEALPPLREMIRTQQSPEKLNFAAASMLSKLGDAEIVGDLQTRKAAFETASPPTPRVRILARYLWRIEVQHPPTRLLEYIASTTRCDYRDMRTWVVRRAHQLGVDASDIRGAILAHAKAASTPLERAELPYLKVLGLRMGILKDTDLPDVKVYEVTETP